MSEPTCAVCGALHFAVRRPPLRRIDGEFLCSVCYRDRAR